MCGGRQALLPYSTTRREHEPYFFMQVFLYLDLPMEILQLIASHLPTTEWARGPSCVCRTLNRTTLPCISIDVRSSQLSCLALLVCAVPCCTPVPVSMIYS